MFSGFLKFSDPKKIKITALRQDLCDDFSFAVESLQVITIGKTSFCAISQSSRSDGVDTLELQEIKIVAPVKEKIVAWNGDGLPPVGALIEYGSDERGWAPVNVIGKFRNNGELCPIGQTGEDGPLCLGDRKFWRPVRTPEQIAAEEREKAIDDLLKVTCINRGEAARIYDAGYRKQK